MNSELDELQISDKDLDDLLELETGTSFAVDLCQVFLLKNRRKILSVLVTELSVLILILVFLIPTGLILLRAIGTLSNDAVAIRQTFSFFFCIAALSLGTINLYFFQQAKQVKSLAKLIDEVDRYNGVIEAIELIEKLDGAQNLPANSLENREEIFFVLKTTRQSLLSALQVEKIMRHHKSAIANRYQLLASLETNLDALMAVEVRNSANECGQLLNDALKIGLDAHREVRKLQGRP